MLELFISFSSTKKNIEEIASLAKGESLERMKLYFRVSIKINNNESSYFTIRNVDLFSKIRWHSKAYNK